MGSRARIASLQRRLLGWYVDNRRDLPWRRTRDPYAIWVSEAMLQQTRVETVLPYYERFLARFPGVRDLAEASEDEVVALWSGLGYYRRARALRAAARVIADEHGGVFPSTREELLALPGVGPYTAGAVLSIAFGAAEPLVDGNVSRVFCRLFGFEERLDAPGFARRLWDVAGRLVPGARPGDWNQALMELGALVCTPRDPECAACPLARSCVARRDGRTDELPRRAVRRAPVSVRLEVLLVERDGAHLLVRRPPGGRMGGMWELPTREVPGEDGRVHGLWPDEHALDVARDSPSLGAVAHSITHHRIRAEWHRGRLGARALPGGMEWATPDERATLGLTGLSRKILRASS